MATIQVTWDNSEKTILRWEMSRSWTLDDFFIAAQESGKMIAETDAPFYILINANGHSSPSSPMASFRSAMANADPRMKRMIIVNSGLFGKMVMELLQQQGAKGTDKQHLSIVDTLDQAYAIINQDTQSQ